jgi:hypothetical protein
VETSGRDEETASDCRTKNLQQLEPRGLAKQGADADYPREIAKAIVRQADTIVGYFEHATVGAF